ncbi:hypothetical protein ACFR97_15185 [Haloplanus litoreus]|uniref:Uncharacterized protein n=1 Tax=Haloplanus litoreus TaxID=767515 RepID=A0ABD5ZWA3_9EURY
MTGADCGGDGPHGAPVQRVRPAEASVDETHREARGGTDSSRDDEYTDWGAVEAFAAGFADTLP